MNKVETHRIFGLGSVEINHAELARIMDNLGIPDWTIDFRLNSVFMPPATHYEDKKMIIRSSTHFVWYYITGLKTIPFSKLLAHECCHAVQGSTSRRRGLLGDLIYILTHPFHPVARETKKWTAENWRLFESVVTLCESNESDMEVST